MIVVDADRLHQGAVDLIDQESLTIETVTAIGGTAAVSDEVLGHAEGLAEITS